MKIKIGCSAKSKAFTLAETLVTLGIIMVVAVMTISAVQKASWEMQQKTQYKKAYNTLNSAILKVKADMGYQMECYYADTGGSKRDECEAFYSELKKNLNIIKNCDTNAYANGCIPYYAKAITSEGCNGFFKDSISNLDPSYVLQDGTIIIQFTRYYPLVMIDINGQKAPNKLGYDVFTFHWGGNGDYIKVSPGTCLATEIGGKTNAQMFEDAFK